MNIDGYVNAKTARQRLGVSTPTLRRWANDGTVKTIRTPGNHRLYAINELCPAVGTAVNVMSEHESNRKVVYCRVSSVGQKDDLERQVLHMRSLYPNHRVITDIGSGINFRRKGLRTILELSSRGLLDEVVVAYRDRLCRFAFELVSWVLSLHKTNLVVLHQDMDSSREAELATDLLAIVNVFNCRVNGRRKYGNTKGRGERLESNAFPKATGAAGGPEGQDSSLEESIEGCQ